MSIPIEYRNARVLTEDGSRIDVEINHLIMVGLNTHLMLTILI